MSDTNPFHKGDDATPTRDERIAEALAEAPAAEAQPDAAPEAPESEAPAAPEAAESEPEAPADEAAPADAELFPEANPADGDDTEPEGDTEPDADPEAEPELFEDEAKPAKAKTVPYKRLQKVIGERNEAREKLEAVHVDLAKAHELNAEFHKHYASFESPAEQFSWDVGFLEKWQALVADPNSPAALREAGQIVMDAMDGKAPTTMSTPTSTPDQTPAPEPQRDPALVNFIETQATSTIDATLASVKAPYRKLIGDYIKGAHEDLSTLTPADVKSYANEWRRDSGFEVSDLLQAPAPEKDADDVREPAPNTSASAQAETRAGEDPKAEKPKPPRDSVEWRQQRDARLAERIQRLGL